MITVQLRDLRFYANHGVHPQEKITGGDFLVNLSVHYKEVSNRHTLDSTIDYAVLYDITKECMHLATALLENVAENICEKVKSVFPQVCMIEIEIVKIRPPITGINGSTAITLHRSY